MQAKTNTVSVSIRSGLSSTRNPSGSIFQITLPPRAAAAGVGDPFPPTDPDAWEARGAAGSPDSFRGSTPGLSLEVRGPEPWRTVGEEAVLLLMRSWHARIASWE